MEYTVIISNQFKKDFRRCIKRGLDMKLITDAMELLKARQAEDAAFKCFSGKDFASDDLKRADPSGRRRR